MWDTVTVRTPISFYIMTELSKYFADQIRDPEKYYKELWVGGKTVLLKECAPRCIQYTGRNFLCMSHHNRVYYGVQGQLIFHLSNSLLFKLGSDSQRDELKQSVSQQVDKLLSKYPNLMVRTLGTCRYWLFASL